MWNIVTLVCAYLCGVALVNASGDPSCPCLTEKSPLFEALQARLRASGLPTSYGLGGCRAYDDANAPNATGGCQALDCARHQDKPECTARWCYIDPEACAVDEDKCVEAGGKPGSDAPDHAVHCRTKKIDPAWCLDGYKHSMLHDSISQGYYYSYHTCSNRDPSSSPKELLANRTFKAVMLPQANLVVSTSVRTLPSIDYEDITPIDGWYGVIVEFWQDVSSHWFNGIDTKAFNTSTLSVAGRVAFPGSSWSAAVYDVGIGKYDTAIGNIWITPERLQHVPFLPAIGQEYLHLYINQTGSEETIWKTLERPFKPLKGSTWGYLT